VKCATKLFLKKGFDRTSIRDIARESKIAMGTLYHYINTKENLLKLVVEYHSAENDEILKKIELSINSKRPEEALLAAISILLEAIEQDKEIFVFVFSEAKLMPKEIRALLLETELQINELFKKILIMGQKQNLFQLNNPTLAAHHIVSMIEMWGVKWWYLKNYTTVEEFNQNLNKFILRAIQKESS
jgi:TetR/AcrR family transcriptional regulator, cholesterol catabolism regulator